MKPSPADLSASSLAPLAPWWRGKKALVTGGAGNLGSHLVEWLVAAGAQVSVADNLSTGRRENLAGALDKVNLLVGDLTIAGFAEECCAGQNIVLHVAGVAPGLQAEGADHAALLGANVSLGSSVLTASLRGGVRRLLLVSSSCVYPEDAPVPTPETTALAGEPEKNNRGYGWAKRHLEALATEQATRHGQELIIVRPFNLYGPRDLWGGRGGHVLPSLLKRVLEPGSVLTLWGDGTQRRSLMHSRDAAWLTAWLAAHRSTAEPVNIGSAEEFTMVELAQALLTATGIDKSIAFEPDRPSGLSRKLADLGLLRSLLGAIVPPATEFAAGVAEVVTAKLAAAPVTR